MKCSFKAFLVALLLFSDGSNTVWADHQPSLAPMLEGVLPAVVSVAANEDGEETVGSGVIVNPARGYILTNGHLVANATRVSVKLSDGRIVRARVIGADAQTDLAVLAIQVMGLASLPFGDSSALKVGDYVVAVGNPYGLSQTATLGIVSALGRSGLGIEGYEDFIQTDASINPGNSGGALVNLEGELVGIPNAMVGPAGSNVGIGLAIPIEVAKLIMARLIEYGTIRRGELGVVAQDLTPRLAAALGVAARSGAVITQVSPGSAAQEAGIVAGDVIVVIGDTPISGAAGLHNAVALLHANAEISVKLLRNGHELRLSATLKSPEQAERRSFEGSGLLADVLFTEPQPGAERCEATGAARVAEVGADSSAAEAGLAAGDIVVSVGLQPVNGPQEVVKRAQGIETPLLLLGVCRSGSVLYLVVEKAASNDAVR